MIELGMKDKCHCCDARPVWRTRSTVTTSWWCDWCHTNRAEDFPQLKYGESTRIPQPGEGVKYSIDCVNKECAQQVHTLARLAGLEAEILSPLETEENVFRVIANG